MKNNEEIVSDLKELLAIANDGKEGYESAGEATESTELKALFAKYMGERIVYAAELKEHVATHGGEAENESGGILGGLHRTWLNIKQALASNEDSAILDAIVTGEKAAITKYDEIIADGVRHADHLPLLVSQREGVKEALGVIEALQVQYNNK
jgi:uncharacterized protein (TIGR02284 family)